MTTLGLEFSSSQRSVALAQNGKVVSAVQEMGGRETRAFTMIERVLAEAGLKREEVECVAIGIGPGSYTGIRIAISIAQGWQLARNIKLLGVSSVDCLAEQAKERGLIGTIRVIIDAQRGEFYLAEYQVPLRKQSGNAETKKQLRIVSAKNLETAFANEGASECGLRARRSGPRPQHWIGPDVPASFPNGIRLFPEAAALVRLAAGRTNFVPGEQLEPIYLRETAFVKAPTPRIIL